MTVGTVLAPKAVRLGDFDIDLPESKQEKGVIEDVAWQLLTK